MKRPLFDHEKLDVYRISLEFAKWVGELIDEGPLSDCKLTIVDHLEDASRSIVNNIAEGNGKRSPKDRARFFDISRGSALESASNLDLLVNRRRLADQLGEKGKEMLVRIVSMLIKLIDSLLGGDQFGGGQLVKNRWKQ